MAKYDTSGVKENYGQGEPIPAGAYQVMTKNAEVCETKSRTGKYLKLAFQVVKGDHEGRVVFHNFNFVNDNEKAVEIGLGQIKGVLRLANADPDGFDDEKLEVFNGVRMDVKVNIRTDERWGDSNELKAFGKVGKFTDKPVADPTTATDSAPTTEPKAADENEIPF